MKSLTRWALPFLILICLPGLAQAHVGVGETSGFGYGFFHPLTGLDHICAMIAVGLWAAQLGGRALWLVPLTFVVVMALGALLGASGVVVPFVEQGILASVFVLGLLIVTALRVPLAASVVLVAIFAIFHGHAHGAEMGETFSGVLYGAGFLIATMLLHLGGIGLGILFERTAGARAVRCAGAVILGFGIFLIVS